MQPGRFCPLHYRYAPADLARAGAQTTECLYVVGGLYGNQPALDAVFELAATEPANTLIVFNGDFNWFNIDAPGFAEVNRRVLEHAALRGNVETELAGSDGAAGCGCAYPDHVGDAEVARSNEIMRQLRRTAHTAPALCALLARLPMHMAVKVGDARAAIVHGDCTSLAGWGLSQEALADAPHRALVSRWFAAAGADIIASSHSCLPVMHDFALPRGRGIVVNNGAAGMPNFRGTRHGVITRIAVSPVAGLEPLYSAVVGGVRVEALPLTYAHTRWRAEFLANWPAGTAAHTAYFERIVHGPRYSAGDANRINRYGSPAQPRGTYTLANA
jgi:hypothetical protein